MRPVSHLIEAMTEALRELDRRSSDRIDVALLWRESDNRVFVTVADHRTGARFDIALRDDDRALDVFHHPFSYAAARGIETDPAAALRRELADLDDPVGSVDLFD
jgi:hypothetical protein